VEIVTIVYHGASEAEVMLAPGALFDMEDSRLPGWGTRMPMRAG
jgi:hypothetical protein